MGQENTHIVQMASCWSMRIDSFPKTQATNLTSGFSSSFQLFCWLYYMVLKRPHPKLNLLNNLGCVISKNLYDLLLQDCKQGKSKSWVVQQLCKETSFLGHSIVSKGYIWLIYSPCFLGSVLIEYITKKCTGEVYWLVGEKNTFHVCFSADWSRRIASCICQNIKNQNKKPQLTTKCQGTIFHWK